MDQVKKICNFIVTICVVIFVMYISFFTDIPVKTGNIIRQKIEEKNNTYEQYTNDFKINELSINMNTYYYNLLTDNQKKIYSSIANGVKNFQGEFVVREYIAGDKEEFASEVNIAIEAFTNDHPEVFYLKSQYSSYIVSSFNGNIGYVKLNYTEENIEEIKNKIKLMSEKIDIYTQGLDGLSEYEKEIKIHDKLSYDIKYSDLEDLPRVYHTSEGTLLEGIGVCDSFTKALQLIYNRVGIDSIIVLGVLENNPHAWNLVKIDDKWYHVDLTSSHSIYNETEIVNHAYFNLDSESIKKISKIDNEDILPKATETKYSFYKYNGLIIEENEDLYSKLRDICSKFKNENYIEFYLEGSVNNKIPSILVALKNIDSTFLNGSKMYYYNIQNAIIIPKN